MNENRQRYLYALWLFTIFEKINNEHFRTSRQKKDKFFFEKLKDEISNE